MIKNLNKVACSDFKRKKGEHTWRKNLAQGLVFWVDVEYNYPL